jgi:hypothetical protein
MRQSLLTYPPYKKYKKIIPRTYNIVKNILIFYTINIT